MKKDDLRNQSPKEQTVKMDFWKTMYSYTSNYSKNLFTSSFIALFVGIIVALQPLAIQPIVDYGILREGADNNERMLWVVGLSAGYMLLGVLRVVVWGFGYRLLLRSIEGTLFNIRSRFFVHIQSLCFRFHDEVSSGELFNYVMGSPMLTIKNFITQFAMMVPYQIVSWLVAIGVLFYYDWLLLLVLLVVVTIVITINMRSRAVVKEVSADFLKKENDASRYVADMFRGTRAIKIHAVEDNTSQVFINQITTIRDSGQTLGWKQWKEIAKPEVVQYIGLGVLYMTGAYSCLYRDMSIGTFMAFINCVGTLMGPLMTFLSLNLLKSNAEAGLERIECIMSRQGSTPEPMAPDDIRASSPINVSGVDSKFPCIQFENVHFSYTEENTENITANPSMLIEERLDSLKDESPGIFQDLNVTIPDGQSVALVGHSGSGKSTFVNLLLRLYDPQSGKLLLYNQDLRSVKQQDLRSSYGVVMQDPFFFQSTIKENVKVCRPNASDEDLIEALKIAQAWDFVQEQPQGINTRIGESGVNLSGGQKQRLAIARAILSKPRFYIFDEATAALDNQSEARIQSAMEEVMKGHTTFIIAHRLSTIRNVDRILLFENGKIEQDGNYEALKSQKGKFQDMLNSKCD